MATETTIGRPLARPRLSGVIIAATIGNVLEWFDFLVYGFFAVTIAEVFFPSDNPTVSLLVTFGTFGLAYVVRPLGAAVIGTYTDRAGRKAGLTLSIGLMLIGTALMLVTPGYATIGIAAPIIITIARLLQGFSVGGEFGSAVAFLVEHGGKRRGFSASWQWATTGIVSIIVSLFGLFLTTQLSHQQLVDWGWPKSETMIDTMPVVAHCRALHPLPHDRDAGVSRGRKGTQGTDQRPVAAAPCCDPACPWRLDRFEQFLLSAPVCPDLRRQDTESAGLYRFCRNARGGNYSRGLLGCRRTLVGQDRAANALDADNGLVVPTDRLPVVLADGRLSLAGKRNVCRRFPELDQGGV